MAAQLDFEVVVYGATPAGIMAAVSVAREGAKVAIIEPGTNVGGMLTGGLSATDVCNKSSIGGLAREFFSRVDKHYGDSPGWRFEPHVAKEILGAFIKEQRLPVFLSHPVVKVIKERNRIVEIVTANAARFRGKIFIDASYEGDLLALSGISYALGREARSVYNESYAGVTPHAGPPKHNWGSAVTLSNSLPLAHLDNQDLAPAGSGDARLPAYNFRLCITNRSQNRVPFEEPTDYNPSEYELLAKFVTSKTDLSPKDLFTSLKIPAGKADLNNGGPFSTDMIGKNWEYAEGDVKTRQRIWNAHKRYTKGLLYFLRSDPRVPAPIRSIMNEWGLCRDEFTESENWPAQLYVREARRLIGEYVLIQSDLKKNRRKPDSIGLATCPIESHHVQRVIRNGQPWNEGYLFAKVKPYQIPFRSIVPKQAECENLLVPVAVSSSHIAYSSLRMEPVYMILGHSAGVAASLAVKNNSAVQQIDLSKLQKKLLEQGQLLSSPAETKPS